MCDTGNDQARPVALESVSQSVDTSDCEITLQRHGSFSFGAETEMGHIPKLGMDFDSVKDAWEFWTEFGARTGFTPCRFYSHTSRKDGLPSSAVFVCNKEGKRNVESELIMKKRERAETRTSCQVKLGIHREPTTFGKYRVYLLHLEHNHVLHTRATVQMMSSQPHITRIQANEIELADTSDIQIKRSHSLNT
uniref:FAR1 domain-containing protein n=1 Tax=Kalanchoe fedtschenkoi TaxID=63787 RepID=A0A7N0RFQ4_KALFE